MLPMCFSKEELVSYPVDQDRIPTAVRAVSGPVLYADHRARARVSVMVELVFIFEKRVFLECLFAF